MDDKIQIITTGDGSHSLMHTGLNETYHSVHGARQESMHVFLKNGLDFFCGRSSQDPVHIFEVGFGTGLNALLTAQYASGHKRKIQYTSVEAFPLDEKIWTSLNYTHDEESEILFDALHRAAWSRVVEVTPFFAINKERTTAEQIELKADSVDVIFFDAFAPSKQPELWEMPVLEKMFFALKRGGVFVTYCAKGQLKRDLKSLSFLVETLDGPPGKKEMVRALKS
jgi:tRNA U34 5-methylaminomethyl-2-thiouridine-forming methyltransferase MnmC